MGGNGSSVADDQPEIDLVAGARVAIGAGYRAHRAGRLADFLSNGHVFADPVAKLFGNVFQQLGLLFSREIRAGEAIRHLNLRDGQADDHQAPQNDR